MQYVIEGLLLGFGLAVLLGPIFIVLVQASIEKGARAGLVAASGIWISDLLFIILSVIFVRRLTTYIEDATFLLWVGIIGSLVLMGTGIASFIKQAKLDFSKVSIRTLDIAGLWTKGFLVNTINPFTLIFWFSTITALVGQRELNTTETWLFCGSILTTIVITDSAKVLGAKLIRRRIDAELLSRINKIAGSALIIFGIVLLVRTLREVH
ncbi:MAG: LysE family transporter [Bacteroidota bacterium]